MKKKRQTWLAQEELKLRALAEELLKDPRGLPDGKTLLSRLVRGLRPHFPTRSEGSLIGALRRFEIFPQPQEELPSPEAKSEGTKSEDALVELILTQIEALVLPRSMERMNRLETENTLLRGQIQQMREEWLKLEEMVAAWTQLGVVSRVTGLSDFSRRLKVTVDQFGNVISAV